MTIAVKKHAKLGIIFLKSCPIFLYLFTLCQIFCPGLSVRTKNYAVKSSRKLINLSNLINPASGKPLFLLVWYWLPLKICFINAKKLKHFCQHFFSVCQKNRGILICFTKMFKLSIFVVLYNLFDFTKFSKMPKILS